ncbi:MAG: RraA family protein [Candidatus Dormibacteraceae bacterium]
MSIDLIFLSPDRVRALTPQNPFERLADGRPRAPQELLERLRQVTNEEAWGTLEKRNQFRYQFAGGWHSLHPGAVLVGRALTAQFVPKRPDLDEVVNAAGRERSWPAGKQNTWLIDSTQPGDVLVVDLFGKVRDGTVIGDNLATALAARTKGGGLVVEGGIRDSLRMEAIEGLQVFHRGVDPSAIAEVTLAQVNGPVRVGGAVVLPGDAVLATPAGVTFIPPHLLEEVVTRSEEVRLRDVFGKLRLSEGTYTSGQIDNSEWARDIEADFATWRSAQGA